MSEIIASLVRVGPELVDAARTLATIPIGGEVAEDTTLVLYRNGAGSITVGDVLNARRALEIYRAGCDE